MLTIIFSILTIVIGLMGGEAFSSEIGSIRNQYLQNLQKRSPKNSPVAAVGISSDLPETEPKIQLMRRFILPSRFALKRNNAFDFEDPRFYSSAFGKRSSSDLMDPRFFSSAFGKRSSDLMDPRFFSSAFGKRSSSDLMDPRFFSSAFGKRSNNDELDPRFFSTAFGKRSKSYAQGKNIGSWTL